MPDIDLNDIKYYPDRFYIQVDGFDTEQLRGFLAGSVINAQQAAFVHEYYHYLTNITSFAGIRQFTLNFCDRFRLVTILAHKAGLDAFPIRENTKPDCANEVAYWNTARRLIDEDDLDYSFVMDVARSPAGRFEITAVHKIQQPETFIIENQPRSGRRLRVKIDVAGLVKYQSFELTHGALDEFLNASIDEFIFEHDISSITPSFLGSRPYFPYRFFDDLLRHYGIGYPATTEKILLAYFALNSQNPPLALIEVLESLRDGGYEAFQQDPLQYLGACYQLPDISGLLQYIAAFSDECEVQGRLHMAQALRYYEDRFYIAHQFKQKSLFYFIKPFLVTHRDRGRFNQLFMQALSRVMQVFTPPLILQNAYFKRWINSAPWEKLPHILLRHSRYLKA